MRVIVSDSSPIRYIVLIGEARIIGMLYGRILIPEAVYSELQQQQTPESVRAWLRNSVECVEVVPAKQLQTEALVSSALHSGERAAIGLALYLNADLLLMDERAGTEEARRLGLNVTGTLGILARGAERGFVDLNAAVDKLRATNFRISPEILAQILAGDEGSSKTA
jgi:predicted nucleic acid-binding protein